MLRSNQSSFLDSLEISERGIVKVASSMVPKGKEAATKTEVQKVLKTFEKSPETKDLSQQYQQRLELSKENPKQVGQQFFEDLRKQKKKMSLSTARCLRQQGIFKIAGRDVYEDLETGDFWKISEDKKHIVRLFKENDQGISDKRAKIQSENVQEAAESPEEDCACCDEKSKEEKDYTIDMP